MKFFAVLAAFALYSTNALKVSTPENHLDIFSDWNNFWNSVFGKNNQEGEQNNEENQAEAEDSNNNNVEEQNDV